MTAAQPPAPQQPTPDLAAYKRVLASLKPGEAAWLFVYRPHPRGSLLVKVDGLIISPASYVEDDPSCGDFHLTWQIDSDEVVSVKYTGL